MQLLLVVALAAVAVAEVSANSQLLGSRSCSWGPGYWCQHLGTMKQCGAAAYCSRLWRRAPLSAPATPEGRFCQQVTEKLRELQVRNVSLARTRRYALALCRHQPEAPGRARCERAVADFLPEVLLLLSRRVPPATVCAALRLRAGPDRATPTPPAVVDDAVVAKAAVAKAAVAKAAAASLLLRGAPVGADAALCDDCVRVIGDVKKAVEDKKAEAEIAATLKQQLCAQLGPLQEACDETVDRYLPQLLQLIDQEIEPKQLCAMLGFCANQKYGLGSNRWLPATQLMKLQISHRHQMNGVECEVCEAMVSEARQLLRNNKTEAEIIDFIKNRVCSIVPAEKDKCIRAVTEYGPVIFQLLASELDPTTVCQALGACGKAAAAAKRPAASPQCLACEFVLRELNRQLGSNRTEAAIESALLTICSKLPQTVRQECDTFVKQYSPIVIQLLAHELNPQLVCTAIGLCASAGQRRLAATAAALPAETPCQVCQTAVTYAKALLHEKATQAEVAQLVAKVCNFLPAKEQPQCRTFVAEYAPSLVELLANDIDPKLLCQKMEICPAKGKSLLLQQQQQQHVYRSAMHSSAGVVRMRADASPEA